ncbi:AAA family ATPase [Myxococcota bacterium]|nr:AAA family ATPase [Myxococcota bacterium]MBU1381859.1 AAA family ATPase [Myxococcota bacterium]MBU1495594.1 AAA family ATPase [Myxococcota bacterium]
MDNDIRSVIDLVKKESEFVSDLMGEVGKVIVGQQYMIERLLIGLFTGGHVLVQGVPGLAKTLTISTLSSILDLKFQRIQFTPDLLPADIIGTVIYKPQTGEFSAKKGPVFANLILADEINRAPAKVQSALLEAMQEKQVTIGDNTHPLPSPFLVMATQNPIEQEGTYPLPEAQLDRFMLMLKVGYPTRDEERQIMDRMTSSRDTKPRTVATAEQILSARNVIGQIYVEDSLKDYITNVVIASREPASFGLKELEDFIEYGASPRATIALMNAARAHAFIRQRGFVRPEDIKAVGPDVLRHRLVLTYEAEAEEFTAEDAIQRIFDQIEIP